MKLIGFLLVTVGFIFAALAAVIDESTVNWIWYLLALAVGVAGVIVIRTHEARHRKTEHHVAANLQAARDGMERIASNIQKVNADKHSIDTYDVRHRLDELFIDDLETFVDARQSIADRYGLTAYADVMSSFAAGERYLNRVWSASADGYVDEVNEYLGRAETQLLESLNLLRNLKSRTENLR